MRDHSSRSIVRRAAALLAFAAAALAASAATPAQQKLSPSNTVRAFYDLLREQHYAEGFALSVYADAVAGLSAEDFAELAPDFQATFSEIPAEIKIKGEKVSGDTAAVEADFGAGGVQTVALVREGGRWLVGDREALQQVRREKTSFFFNARIEVNQNNAYMNIKSIAAAEDSYTQQAQIPATLDDLVAAKLLPEGFRGGSVGGYRYAIAQGDAAGKFSVTAVPERYGRSGRLSFYATATVVRAADKRGEAVGADAPAMTEVTASPASGGRP